MSGDDISAVVAFDLKTAAPRIGVMWSNQNDDAMYFASYRDDAPDGEWQATRTAVQGSGTADDHINLKSLQTDPAGRVFAAVKTSLDKTGSQNAPQIFLSVLGQDGDFDNHVFGRVGDRHTRSMVLIDRSNRDLYMFATAPTGGGAIYYKKTSLTDIFFEEGRGTPFIQRSSDPKINDATSTKQTLGSQTGLLVPAADDTTGYYLHNRIEFGSTESTPPADTSPADGTPPDTAIGSGSSRWTRETSASFTFSSTERGSAFECALDGSGFKGCASPRGYTNLPDGEHVFRVRATDAAGNTDESPARRVWTVDTVRPTVRPVSPRPRAKIRDRAPAIKATVRDNRANLSKWNIRLFVAGKEIPRRNFKYNRKTDRLVHSSQKLAPGKRYVRVVARDQAGNKKVRSWHFRIAH